MAVGGALRVVLILVCSDVWTAGRQPAGRTNAAPVVGMQKESGFWFEFQCAVRNRRHGGKPDQVWASRILKAICLFE